MQDLINHLHGATVFSKLDLIKGYHLVPVKEEDKVKTAIITLFGLFEYNFIKILVIIRICRQKNDLFLIVILSFKL